MRRLPGEPGYRPRRVMTVAELRHLLELDDPEDRLGCHVIFLNDVVDYTDWPAGIVRYRETGKEARTATWSFSIPFEPPQEPAA